MLVVLVVAIVALLSTAALAIDLGIAYGVKTKLAAAADAASLAAGRAVKRGIDDASRIANARTAAAAYFSANFSNGFLGSTVSAVDTAAVRNRDGSWTLTTTATGSVPSSFAKLMGRDGILVTAVSESTVRTLDMVLVLDCSGSMESSFDDLKRAASNFVGNFQDGDGGDRIGLIAFASGAVVEVPIEKSERRGFRKRNQGRGVLDRIESLSAQGTTASGEALRLAQAELDSIPRGLRSTLRVIVFFSDGAPNDVAGIFASGGTSVTGTLYSGDGSGAATLLYAYDQLHHLISAHPGIDALPSTDYTGTVSLASYNNIRTLSYHHGFLENTRCNVNKAARNMVENVANAARSGGNNDVITIYTLGLGYNLQTIEFAGSDCSYGSRERGENILKRLANTSDSDTYNPQQPTGMYVYAESSSGLDAAFQTIANRVLRISR